LNVLQVLDEMMQTTEGQDLLNKFDEVTLNVVAAIVTSVT
jgi:hypothetical protein